MSVTDASFLYSKKFSSKYYVEAKAGTAILYMKSDEDFHDISDDVESNKTNKMNLYLGANAAINRFFINSTTCINKDFDNLQFSLSMAVKPCRGLALRFGLNALNIYWGNDEVWERSEDDNLYNMTTSANFGLEWNLLKNRLFGSLDIYNTRVRDESVYESIDLKNFGLEFVLGAKILDMKRVKWRVNANIAVNESVIGNEINNEEHLLYLNKIYSNGNTAAIEGKSPLTYTVYDQVYDNSGNPIQGLYSDIDENGLINEDDLIVRHSPIPSIVAGFSTKLETFGFYLQADAHINADRYNCYVNENYADSYFLDSGSEYVSSENVSNSSFFRMDDIVLGYKSSKSKIPWQVYAAVQNPFVITNYEGSDPEIADGLDDGYFYQRPTIYSLGVKINFKIK